MEEANVRARALTDKTQALTQVIRRHEPAISDT